MKDKAASVLKKCKKKLKIIIPLAIVIVAVVFFFVWKSRKSQDTYITDTVERRDVATYLTYTGNVEATNNASIIPKVAQTVTAVNVSIGDEVKAGDVIATLDDTTIQRSIQKQEANLSTTELNNYYSLRDSQKTYEQYKTDLENGQNTQLMSAENNVKNALEAYESAKETYERDKLELENNMDSSLINSNQQVQQAKLNLENAQKAYDDNEADIRGLEKGVDNADEQTVDQAEKNLEAAEDKRTQLQQNIDSAQMSYDNAVNSLLMSYYNTNLNLEQEYKTMQQKYEAYQQALDSYDTTLLSVNRTLENYEYNLEKTEASANNTSATIELDSLYDQLDDYKIIAPIDGTITALNFNVGDSLTTNGTVAEVTNYSEMKVQIKISEDDITTLDNGSEMTVTVDAIGKTYSGVIENMSKKATVSNNVSYFTADVVFEGDDEIRSGLSAEVKYLKSGVENVVSVSMSALNYDTDNTAYVLVGKDINSAQKKTVTLGMTNGVYVEITDGLSEGDTVLIKQSKTSDAMMTMGMGGGDMGQMGGGAGGGDMGGGGNPGGGGAGGGAGGGGGGRP